ncbi:MAG: hypothetical protein Q9191_006951 [Dirinaria sp. TL-2023a]
MADLEITLAWLGISQYHDRFVQAGFDSWETLLEITEADLNALNVEEVHQEKLQREIANTRRLARDTPIVSPINKSVSDSAYPASSSISSKNEPRVESSGKRGYRHRPKPDENAPQRPYSAYVLFSNHVREEVKDQSLPFIDISRQVGERWQAMSPADKDSWKQKAAVPWEKYKQEMVAYKKTENYVNYAKYLEAFETAPANRKVAIKAQSKHASSPDSNDEKDSRSSGASLPQNARSKEGLLPGQTFRTTDNSVNYVEGLGVSAKRRETGVPISRVRPSVISEVEVQRRAPYMQTLPRFRHGVPLRGRKKEQREEPPEVEHKEDSISKRIGQSTAIDHGSDSGGESVASGVGSMGSTDHVNADNLQHSVSAEGEQPFLGQASDLQWMQKLTTNLTKKPMESISKFEQRNNQESTQINPTDLHHAGLDTSKPDEYLYDIDNSFAEDQIDPYGLPIKPTTDTLIDIYFATIHPSFPVLDQNVFLDEYSQYVASVEPRTESRFRIFVPVLQLVLAIGAIHAHLTHAEWAGHDRDHLLFFARARSLGTESGLFEDRVYAAQIETFGLSAMYFLATHQLNRAWNVLGLAIRSAQALGMHLENHLQGLKEEDKLTRVRMWYAIVSLERTLCLVTGRPAMVKSTDCSAPVPLPPSLPDEGALEGISTSSQTLSPAGHQTRPASSTTSTHSSSTCGPRPYDKASESITTTFFFYYLELNALGQRVLESLYSPDIRLEKWSAIQARVSNLNAQLSQWHMTLPAALNSTIPSKDPRVESFKVALAILSNSLRTIINRPSLCSRDRLVPHQSESSVNADHDNASLCVSSARAVLALLPTEPNPQSIRQSPVWWTLTYYIKRAVTVLMLEMSFRAKHMPSEAEEMLKDAKKGMNWLLSMASTSSAARISWDQLSRLLRLVAPRIGGSTDDIMTAPLEHQSPNFMPSFQPWPEHMSKDPRGFDPDIWEPMDFMAHGDNSFPLDVQTDSRLGPIDPILAQDPILTMNGVDVMMLSQAYQAGRSQDWFGFDPGPY